MKTEALARLEIARWRHKRAEEEQERRLSQATIARLRASNREAESRGLDMAAKPLFRRFMQDAAARLAEQWDPSIRQYAQEAIASVYSHVPETAQLLRMSQDVYEPQTRLQFTLPAIAWNVAVHRTLRQTAPGAE